jgi:zinc protease
MRRKNGVIVGGALLAACSSSGGVSVTTHPSDPEVSSGGHDQTRTDDTGSDGAGEATGLPGLLDSSDESIPNDDEVTVGTLDNGLDYLVRTNDNPGGKAELRLVVGAGSVDEFGPSTGVAHFVEHMLFNGTEEYPENELVDLLRSFGAAFGADVNAYTSFDETVYTLTVPNTEESIAAGMSILAQWLSHATFDPDQVVAERGVVRDEWRVRTQSNQGRLFGVAEAMYLPGTPYEGRSPIGDIESIEAIETDELRAYYDAWYRPDNATVIVVGDIDVDEMVDQIEDRFGQAEPRADDSAGRPDTSFDVLTVPEFGLHADPDQQTVDVEITLPLPSYDGRADGTAALRVALIDQMIYDAIVRRLDDDITAGTAPFDQIAPGTNSFVATLDAPALYAFTDAERSAATVQALLDEYAGVDRNGFTERDAEVARARARVPFQNRYDGRESTQDSVYADQYVEHALRGAPYPPIDVEYDIVTAELDDI